MSSLFQQVMYQLGIKQVLIILNHKGHWKDFTRHLKMLRMYCVDKECQWDDGVHLP